VGNPPVLLKTTVKGDKSLKFTSPVFLKHYFPLPSYEFEDSVREINHKFEGLSPFNK